MQVGKAFSSDTSVVGHIADLPDRINSLTSVYKVPFYNDEPKIFQYTAEFRGLQGNNPPALGYGSDLNRHSAARKAVCEAIERGCLFGSDHLRCLRRQTSQISGPFISPSLFQPFNPNQLELESYRRMRIPHDAEFSWVLGVNAINDEETWLPAQLVLCPYDVSSEPLIRFPSSNGTALGLSADESRCRAALEVFERDAFMCWYLAAMPADLLDLKDSRLDGDIANLEKIYLRYQLDLKILLLPSRWPFPVVFAVVIDRTGLGPWLRVGMKCHPHLHVAIKGAVAEAQQMRPWLRDEMLLHDLPGTLKKSDVTDAWSRALFWARPEQFELISPLWTSARVRALGAKDSYCLPQGEVDWGAVWEQILLTARERGADLYFCDLSGDLQQELGVTVFKAVIPQAHPLYMDERYPYLQSASLTSALESFGPRWQQEKTGDYGETIPPHPFS